MNDASDEVAAVLTRGKSARPTCGRRTRRTGRSARMRCSWGLASASAASARCGAALGWPVNGGTALHSDWLLGRRPHVRAVFTEPVCWAFGGGIHGIPPVTTIAGVWRRHAGVPRQLASHGCGCQATAGPGCAGERCAGLAPSVPPAPRLCVRRCLRAEVQTCAQNTSCSVWDRLCP